MSQIHNYNIKMLKPQDILLGILKIYAFYRKIQQRALGPGESTAGVTQYLPLRVQPITQWFTEGCIWSIVVTQLRLVLRLHVNTSIPGTMPQEPCHRNPGKGAKPDHVIQVNCGELRTHASYKTTRTRENFNNRGTKNDPPFRRTMINSL